MSNQIECLICSSRKIARIHRLRDGSIVYLCPKHYNEGSTGTALRLNSVVVDQEWFNHLPDSPTDFNIDYFDLLDLKSTLPQA